MKWPCFDCFDTFREGLGLKFLQVEVKRLKKLHFLPGEIRDSRPGNPAGEEKQRDPGRATVIKPCSYLLRTVPYGIHLIRIRIQHFGLNTDSDPIQIRGIDDQKQKKNLQLEIFFFYKNYNLPIIRPSKGTFKLQKKPSVLKREHAALQNSKFQNFLQFLCVIFVLLSGDGFRIRIRMRIH